MNYYELLGVKNNATEEEIKNAYKTQMKKWHPDINKTEEAVSMSTKLNEAKEVLLDDVKRKDYDIYLKNKSTYDYNKYTQMKNSTNVTDERKTVTKWQYLKDWLKNSTYSNLRKAIGVIGVLLESFMCIIIKILLISFSFICNIAFYFIWTLLINIYPLILILLIVFIIMVFTNGFSETINNNKEVVNIILVILITFISSFILPKLSRIVLSPKVFNILYNKIDINLFKLCVGYKN